MTWSERIYGRSTSSVDIIYSLACLCVCLNALAICVDSVFEERLVLYLLLLLWLVTHVKLA